MRSRSSDIAISPLIAFLSESNEFLMVMMSLLNLMTSCWRQTLSESICTAVFVGGMIDFLDRSLDCLICVLLLLIDELLSLIGIGSLDSSMSHSDSTI